MRSALYLLPVLLFWPLSTVALPLPPGLGKSILSFSSVRQANAHIQSLSFCLGTAHSLLLERSFRISTFSHMEDLLASPDRLVSDICALSISVNDD